MTKPEIRIFSNLARAGGTLTSRCLGCMKNVLLFSEIHPLGHQVGEQFNLLSQAVNVHRFVDVQALGGKQYSFNELVMLLQQRCQEQGLQLVLRDWAHLDYMAVPFLQQPYYQCRLAEVLMQDFKIRQFHLVRHPIPQWLSSHKLAILHDALGIDLFIKGYYYYAKAAVANGFVRYEDFTHAPEQHMQTICHGLELDYDPEFMLNWTSYDKITGDTVGITRTEIKPALARRPADDVLEQFHASPFYWQSLELLGYSDVI